MEFSRVTFGDYSTTHSFVLSFYFHSSLPDSQHMSTATYLFPLHSLHLLSNRTARYRHRPYLSLSFKGTSHALCRDRHLRSTESFTFRNTYKGLRRHKRKRLANGESKKKTSLVACESVYRCEHESGPTRPMRCHALTECRREVIVFAVSYHSENESYGGPLLLHRPIPLTSDILFLFKKLAKTGDRWLLGVANVHGRRISPYFLVVRTLICS
ncbi:hypothetical protein EVAR_37381_1 [Eumeta japonica]|uniref:Uncharacterized protein n=1 Tax=Eumeta variegata TaxID=151549 RepID=A0A4C1ZN59_EUMVA|nr:hypothetical protein EVAR_37381_1 [Eumeta japonica]